MLRARGVGALYLFGSYAREEAAEASDVDLFVDPADSNEFGLIPLFDSQPIIESVFPGMEIGFSTRDSIVPRYRSDIERDAIRIF
jgi:predicted nucleotidyltransferase